MSYRFIILLVIGLSMLPAASDAKPTPKKPPKHACLQTINPVCNAIAKLTPSIDLDYALRLSAVFIKVAKSHHLPTALLVSIAKQESNFQIDAVRSVRGLIIDDGSYRDGSVGSDFCMMQINVANIKKMKLDVLKLTADAEYCINAGAMILDGYSKNKKNDKVWWTRYNAISTIHRRIYQEHILKHWRKLDPQVDSQV